MKIASLSQGFRGYSAVIVAQWLMPMSTLRNSQLLLDVLERQDWLKYLA